MFTPAKLNLGLRVRGRRADGYHEIESVFVPLDLGDTVAVEETRAPGIRLRVAGLSDGVPADASNLAWRAARAFADAAGLEGGLAIELHKEIPAAAGLGGGSSDAGAVLRLLAERHPGRLGREQLAELALGIGADVPWFLDPRPALVTGIGERIEPLRDGPALALLLGNPGIPLATAEVYRVWDALDGALTAPEAASTMPPPAWGSDEPPASADLEAWLRNDLEPAAVRLCPPIARLRTALGEADARAVGLSGSGPTLFGLFADTAAAEEAARAVRWDPPAWWRVARTTGAH